MQTLGFVLFGIAFDVTFANDVASQSQAYADEYCSKVTEKLTFSHMDDTMISRFVLSPNYLEQVVFDTSCSDILSCLREYQGDLIRTGIRAGFALVFAVFTLIAYILIAPCGCCKCCRTCRGWCCCRQTRKVGYNFKRDTVLFIWVTTFVLLAAVAVDIVFSIRFLEDFNNGGEAALCQTFTLVDNVLNGNNGTYVDPVTGQMEMHDFIGSTAAQEVITSLYSALEANSTVTTGIATALSQTANLNQTITEFGAWLLFVQSQLSSSIIVSDHTCVACKACCDTDSGSGSYIDQLINVSLPQSYAASVVILRTILDVYFSSNGISMLNKALSDANSTLVEFTNTFENDIATYLVDNKSTIDLVLDLSKWLSIGIVAAITIPLIVFITSVTYAIFKSNRSSYTDPNIKPLEPWCSWCGWSLWFLYGFLILLIAGALGLLGYIEGASCEMSSNMDYFVNKTYWRLQNTSDTLQSSSIETVVNQCAISTGSGLLLEGIVVDEAANITASDVLLAASTIIQQFDVVYANTSVSKKFVDDIVFRRLVFSLRNYGNMYIKMADQIESMDPPIASNPSLSQLGFSGVASCNSLTNLAINGTIGDWIIESINAAGGNVSESTSTVTLAGASDYYAALTAAGIDIGSPGPVCPSDFAQSSATQNPPWGQLMLDKMGVVEKTNYACSLFAYTWDAIANTGSFSTTSAQCTYSEFGTYMLSLATTLEAKAAAMDAAAANAAGVIDAYVRQPLNEQVLPYLLELTYGLDCQFINDRLVGFYNSLCWAHTPGVIGLCFALFGFGLIAWFGITAQFVVWRHLRGNKDAWKDAVRGPKATVVEMAKIDPRNSSDTYGGATAPRDPRSVVTASDGNRNVVVVQSDA